MPGHEVEADDYDGLGANPSEADGEAELEAFFELLTESFYDVDETLSGSISFEACPSSSFIHLIRVAGGVCLSCSAGSALETAL